MKQHWSPAHQAKINAAIEHALQNNPHPFAVFDADNTVWQHDLTEAFMAWMEVKGHITITGLDATTLPCPPRPNETLMSYYDLLCEADQSLGYLFATQVFAGFTLGVLRAELDEMMASAKEVMAPMRNGPRKAIPVPQIFPAQLELIETLQARGIEVWIVSASLEELVRMVMSDPKYGINLPPERIIGVNLVLQKPDMSATVGAIERRDGHCGTAYYLSESRMQWTLTSTPFAPLTWYGGKVAAILEWIDESQRPILVAGDSPNDFYMQFHAAAGDSGIRLRIHVSQSHKEHLNARIARQQAGNLNDQPDQGWIEVTAQDLGIPS